MRSLLSCVAYFALLVNISAADDVGIQAPDGFEVTLYADDSLAHDIYSMTVDAQGRVVVAGAGYVKVLHDRGHDETAEDATLFSTKPGSGAHGMYFDGPDLIPRCGSLRRTRCSFSQAGNH